MRKIVLLSILGSLFLLPMSPALAGDDRDYGDKKNRNGNDCNEQSQGCSDEDLSPKFYDSPVTMIICVHPDSCNFN